MSRVRRGVAALIALPVLVASLITGAVLPAHSAEAGAFDPGYIISDGQFFDGDAMTAAEVQSFLQQQVPVCNTWHTGVGDNQPPFTCLKDFRMDHPVEPADDYCAEVPAGNHSAAEIIALVGQACGISQKVLLVLLQKEQSLVTDTWPWARQYRSATGYGCPDTADCDARYYGFFNQVVMAAWAYKYYTANPARYRYKAGQWNEILYHPNTACGTRSVFIQNAATAALYIYTPYTPNAASLGNLYGLGDSCSTYGNRNFWRIYTDWFGSPTDIIPAGLNQSRFGGSDRYDSSAKISAQYFEPGVPVAYIASGADFADAISAAPAAAIGGGPVLLVERNRIPAPIEAELTRLAPQRIVVVGGSGAVSDAVASALQGFSPLVERVAGDDRFGTSQGILEHAFGDAVPQVYLATGSTFADALSASAAAGHRGSPVLLVDGSLPQLREGTVELLQLIGATSIVIAGGTGVVSVGIEQQLQQLLGPDAVQRLAGANRYATSGAINRDAFETAETFFLASGEDFPDALSAAPVAAMHGAPLYVTPPSCVPRDLAQHVIDAGATSFVIAGGTGAVTEAVTRFRNC